MSYRVKIAIQRKPAGKPGWPNINFDYEKEFHRIYPILREGNPDAQLDVCWYTAASQAEADWEKDKEIYDGVLVLLMTNWVRVDQFYLEKAKEGFPVIVADVPYCGSGSILTGTSAIVREQKLPVPVLATRNYRRIAEAVRLFGVLKRMKTARVLVVNNNPDMAVQKAAGERWGVTFINRTSADLMKKFGEVDPAKARATADRWEKEALGILEPSDADILESAQLYHAIMAMKEETRVDALTIDCLQLSYNGIYDESRHMYPCLSYYQMGNDGEIGICEADVNSTISAMLTRYTTGRPGYVSDPVVDTCAGQITYAHCVACCKVFGENDPRTCQYYLRSHAEDNMGASVQIVFPSGEDLTTINIDHVEGVACIHSSRSEGNAFIEGGCRSKLVARAEAGNLLENWLPMWHRVTVFGEYRSQFLELFRMKGLKVLEEDKKYER